MIKELKEKLSQFPDDLIVMIPNNNLRSLPNYIWYVPAAIVARGCNEADGCVFIDNGEED